MNSILFICTGNIFRSMVAEYALKARLGDESVCVVGSAGIEAKLQRVHPVLQDRLLKKGADPSAHVQRRLTGELLDHADFAVAMGLDHREFIRRNFRREALLFNQVCYQREEPVLDICEAVPDWETNLEAARDHAFWVVDYIWDAMPRFIEALALPRQSAAEQPHFLDRRKA